MTPRIRSACYRRVSKDKQNLDNQTAGMQAYCDQRGWEPVWYDEKESGASNSRAVFMELTRAVFAGEVQAVLVWALDRMGRDQTFVLAQIQAFEAAGVKVASVSESWLENDDDNKPILLGVTTGQAAAELKRLKRRIREGLGSGRDATGHRVSTKGKRLGRHPKPLSLLLEAKRLVVSGECSIRAAAARVSVGYPKRPTVPGGLCAISEGTLRKFLKGTWKGDRAELGPSASSARPAASPASSARLEAPGVRHNSEPISTPPDDLVSHT
jgi:DNA invertase Pin-like site-specific DNA recombinase